ncbi:MAG: hypothetical protein ACW98Y_09810 [Candidatus Thorarchaeota archaeon]
MVESDITKIAEIARKTGDLGMTLSVIRTVEAEKRTYLAQLRTGIGILTIPMSLLTILIATSEYYMIDQVLSFIVGLVFGILVLSTVGTYLVADSLRKLRSADKFRHDTCDETEEYLDNDEYLHIT